jgi:3-oxoacyl-[acyl-carrier-protein] synthase II
MGSDAARTRVAVTGLGAVCAWGWGVPALREGLSSGKTAIAPFARFDHSRHRTHVAGEVPEGPGPAFDRGPLWGRLSYADRFALFAAREALDQAGLLDALDPAATGVYFGTSTGGMLESEDYFAELMRHGGARTARPSLMASQQLNAPGDMVARELAIGGPVQTLSSACASGALAIGAALAGLRSGEIDVAIAGGSDSLCRITYAGFNALRAVDESPCRPFREGRAGMSLGEGAAVLVLEREDHLRRRGGRALAELRGAGASCDAGHMTAPDPDGTGAAAAMRAALADAGLPPEAIDFVNAHGTGTPLNDAAEFAALARVFGERARQLPLTSTKGVVGHLLGSSGAIEAVASILGLLDGSVHAAPGGGRPDPAIPVRLALDTALPVPGADAALSTSLAFGGANAALVLGRWAA